MKSIELTIRLRVPDDTTEEQLAAINIIAVQATVEGALEYLDGSGSVVAVTPLQDVLVMNGHVG